MNEQALVPAGTIVQSKGDGPIIALDESLGRVFLMTLAIISIVEQEFLELSIFVSADSTTWSAKPLNTYPQKFYRGEYPFLLDLTAAPEAKFIRAHWEVARWGRGSEAPAFEFGVVMKAIPAEVQRELSAKS